MTLAALLSGCGQYYADNRQADEISAAMRKAFLEPAIEELGAEKEVSGYCFNRLKMDSLDECVFTEYFDGNIQEYVKKEKVRLIDFEAAITAQNFREKAERFNKALASCVQDSYGYIYVMAEDHQGEPDIETGRLYSGNPAVRACAIVSFERGISWYENVYVEVMPGVRVSSGAENLVLEPGDVTFVEAGTGADLQKLLDEGYYSLPVEAEENKSGGYMARDQKHESRVVLQDPEAPVYRLQFSQKVREREESNGKITLYFMMDRSDIPRLWYYTNNDTYKFTVFSLVESGRERGTSAYLSGGELIYPGPVKMVKYDE